jgi:GNAT superfamily N-acetyltransferase
VTDRELYRRGAETLVASWAEYARPVPGAALLRGAGVDVAVFPRGPERGVFNNALLARGLDRPARARALDAMRAAYAAAGVERFAAWVQETDAPMQADVERLGFVFDTSTRAMGMELDRLGGARPALDLAAADWDEYLRVIEVPPGLLAAVDRASFHVAVACADGVSAAAAMAFDLAGDCGIYNVATRPPFRRRGLATALTAHLLHDARQRGCRTASLQATEMAEDVYAGVGFRDLGRYLEYVPAPAAG